MDPYYSSPSYYYQQSCPLHDSYYSYYYDQSPQVIPYNNSPTNVYSPPTPSVSVVPTTPALNTTFESGPPRRRRRQRTIFTKDQVDVLDQVFEKSPYPDIQLREELSQQLDVPESRIQVWFKNRRSRARTTIKSKN